jgi:hypothetical protein
MRLTIYPNPFLSLLSVLTLLTMPHSIFSLPSPPQSLSLSTLSDLAHIPTHRHQNRDTQPRALIYAGPATSADLAESVGHLLKTSPSNFTVTYVGGNASDFDDDNVYMVPRITEEVLGEVDLFAADPVSLMFPHPRCHHDATTAGPNSPCSASFLSRRSPFSSALRRTHQLTPYTQTSTAHGTTSNLLPN